MKRMIVKLQTSRRRKSSGMGKKKTDTKDQNEKGVHCPAQQYCKLEDRNSAFRNLRENNFQHGKVKIFLDI